MLCDFWVHCSCIAFTTSKQSKCVFAVSWKWIWCDVSAVQFQKPHMSTTEANCNCWTLKNIVWIIWSLVALNTLSLDHIFSCLILERSSVMLRLAAEGQNSNLAESNGWRDSVIQLLGRMSEGSQFIEKSIWRIAGKILHFEIPTGYSNLRR